MQSKGKDWKEQAVAEQKRIDWATKTFDIDDVQNDPDRLESVVIPGIGKVNFKRLTTEEMRAFKQFRGDDWEISLRVLHKMLNKADPKVTYAKVQRMDPFVSGAIMKAIIGVDRFFLVSQAPKT